MKKTIKNFLKKIAEHVNELIYKFLKKRLYPLFENDVLNTISKSVSVIHANKTLEEIENYTGRIWVIDAADSNMYDYISEMEGTNIIKNKEEYSHPFSGDKFIISLFEKK